MKCAVTSAAGLAITRRRAFFSWTTKALRDFGRMREGTVLELPPELSPLGVDGGSKERIKWHSSRGCTAPKGVQVSAAPTGNQCSHFRLEVLYFLRPPMAESYACCSLAGHIWVIPASCFCNGASCRCTILTRGARTIGRRAIQTPLGTPTNLCDLFCYMNCRPYVAAAYEQTRCSPRRLTLLLNQRDAQSSTYPHVGSNSMHRCI